jgi:CBS domain containing-hemolysin-like protein
MDSKDESGPPAEAQPASPPPRSGGAKPDVSIGQVIRGMLRNLGWLRNGDPQARDMLDDLMIGRDEADVPLDADERTLVANILNLRDCSAEDVMVPRADIVAVDSQASLEEIIALMIRSGHSRLPVYRETLDDAIGMVHIKDVLAWRGGENAFQVAKIVRPVLFVAPSMEVLQLLLEMRGKRSHMAIVVDEFGGVDGLLTIEDVVEEIVGEIADEHDRDVVPAVVRRGDGGLDADARAAIEVLEEHFGPILSEEEREDIDTVGGLVVSLAGRVPGKGETVGHPTGVVFQVLDADPRRIKRVRINRADPQPSVGDPGTAAGSV